MVSWIRIAWWFFSADEQRLGLDWVWFFGFGLSVFLWIWILWFFEGCGLTGLLF
jgi:hypothetical protein